MSTFVEPYRRMRGRGHLVRLSRIPEPARVSAIQRARGYASGLGLLSGLELLSVLPRRLEERIAKLIVRRLGGECLSSVGLLPKRFFCHGVQSCLGAARFLIQPSICSAVHDLDVTRARDLSCVGGGSWCSRQVVSDEAAGTNATVDSNDVQQPSLFLHAFQTHEAICKVVRSGLSPGSFPQAWGRSLISTTSLSRSQTLLCRLIALAVLLEPAAFDHFPRQSHCAYRLSAAGMVERVSVLNQVAVYTCHSQRLDHPGKENEGLVGHCLSQARVLPRRAPLTRRAARSIAAPKVSPSKTSVVQCASTATLVAANAPPIARNTAVFLG